MSEQVKKIFESPFGFKRDEVLRDPDEAALLKHIYPLLSTWSDDSVQNSWDMYARAVLSCSSISPAYHEEFVSFLAYVCSLDEPDKFNAENCIDIEMLRDRM